VGKHSLSFLMQREGNLCDFSSLLSIIRISM